MATTFERVKKSVEGTLWFTGDSKELNPDSQLAAFGLDRNSYMGVDFADLAIELEEEFDRQFEFTDDEFAGMVTIQNIADLVDSYIQKG